MDLTCGEEMLDDSPYQPNILFQIITQDQLLPPNFQMGPAPSQQEILNYPEILEYMLLNDTYNRPDPNYFSNVQIDITPAMRRTVTCWMREVCKEEGLTECVFPRATIMLDRFLSFHKIERTQFQLLGATCLLLSSKWAGTVMALDRLVFFTANSITIEMLREWEFLVMLQIEWDVYCLTPNEFIEPLLHKLPQNLWDPESLKTEIINYTTFCCTDFAYCIYTPSIIAAASFAAAIQKSHLSQEVVEQVLSQLENLTKVHTDLQKSLSHDIVMKYEVSKMLENLNVPGQNPGANEDVRQDEGTADEDQNMIYKLAELSDLEQAETPTDVRDIEF